MPAPPGCSCRTGASSRPAPSCSPPAASRRAPSCASATSAGAGAARACGGTRSTPARCCWPRWTRAPRPTATGAHATASPGTSAPTRAAATASSPTSTRAAAIRSESWSTATAAASSTRAPTTATTPTRATGATSSPSPGASPSSSSTPSCARCCAPRSTTAHASPAHRPPRWPSSRTRLASMPRSSRRPCASSTPPSARTCRSTPPSRTAAPRRASSRRSRTGRRRSTRLPTTALRSPAASPSPSAASTSTSMRACSTAAAPRSAASMPRVSSSAACSTATTPAARASPPGRCSAAAPAPTPRRLRKPYPAHRSVLVSPPSVRAMRTRIRISLLAGAALLLAVAGTTLHQSSAKAADVSGDPQTMNEFLTAVTTDVDAYWTKAFEDAGLPEPRVGYSWSPPDQSMAAYSPQDDTIYISEQFATAIYDGALDQQLPGSSQGYGGTVGDFAVAYIVAHEYGHQIQDELGLFEKYGGQVPTMAFELQADCYAGTWAQSASREQRLEDGDVQEAVDAALAVGDFDTDNPNHHGTPEQRKEAWSRGFEAGDPSACDAYLDPATSDQAQ